MIRECRPRWNDGLIRLMRFYDKGSVALRQRERHGEGAKKVEKMETYYEVGTNHSGNGSNGRQQHSKASPGGLMLPFMG